MIIPGGSDPADLTGGGQGDSTEDNENITLLDREVLAPRLLGEHLENAEASDSSTSLSCPQNTLKTFTLLFIINRSPFPS